MLDWLFEACLESALVSILGIFLGLTLGAQYGRHAASLDLEASVTEASKTELIITVAVWPLCLDWVGGHGAPAGRPGPPQAL